ncbi:unnamed protein product [Linum tenue]|uniref:Transcription factor MYC/MYB N-terminal domain-containing protein n=1 Tax=Linum tenue TaxID=586396 RepID=A0AAV0S5S9_9ROSI|nr:unnamed protein product [Linum tenue]
MEEHLSPLAITHLLQHTLRSLCNHDNSQWVYAVFWRILPRNYPPPKWDGQGAYDRSRGNRRNWILVWEDGYCNFAASSATAAETTTTTTTSSASASGYEFQQQQYHQQQHQGLQPELFFKMSHEIYNYGEGLIGKVAADHSHKWVHKEPNEQEINFLSTWHNSADSQPRTWEAQFQSGIKTIALIAVREGVVQLGAVHKVVEDLSYVVTLRKKLSYIESIPGVLLPHPCSSPTQILPVRMDGYAYGYGGGGNHPMLPPPPLPHHHHEAAAYYQLTGGGGGGGADHQLYADHHNNNHMTMMMNSSGSLLPFKVAPSMSSLEALLSKLPSVVPPPPPPHHHEFMGGMEEEAAAGGDRDDDDDQRYDMDGHHEVGESSSSKTTTTMTSSHGKSGHRRHHHHHHEFHLHHRDLNVNRASTTTTNNNAYFQ